MGLSGDTMRWFFWLLVLLLALPTRSFARTWHVLADGTGDAPSVRAAVDRAAIGDTIVVGPGQYRESIGFLGTGVVIRASPGPVVREFIGIYSSGLVGRLFGEVLRS
jgi:hypothetical protein